MKKEVSHTMKSLHLPLGHQVPRRPVNRRQVKNGSYSVTLTAIVIGAAILLNLIVGELPSTITQIDLTSQQLSTLTEQSEEILSDLSQDVTIYYIVQDSSRDTYVSRLLERYNDFAHITVEEKDPVLYPEFTSQYTDEVLADNSVIVVSGESSRMVAYESIYESSFDYSYYSYQTTGFDGEGQITSAICAVTSDDLPKLYTLTGHNELELNNSLATAIEKENIETESLNLITSEQVPEDAACLLISSPTTDLSDEETEKILEYLKAGGRVILITDHTDGERPNLDRILEYYGVSLTEGIVMEQDANYYVQLPFYLIPSINSTDVSSDMTGGSQYVLLAAAQGIETLDDIREDVTVTSILTTSASAYSKTDVAGMTTYSKEEGDVDGPFDLAVLITETVEAEMETDSGDEAATEDETATEAETEEADETETASEAVTEAADGAVTADETETADGATGENETESSEETGESRLALFTSSSLIDASADQMVSGGNSRLFVNTLSWLCGHETSVSIPVKSMSTSYLTLTAASSSFWSILVIAVIPGIFLAGGLWIWLKRRRQ